MSGKAAVAARRWAGGASDLTAAPSAARRHSQAVAAVIAPEPSLPRWQLDDAAWFERHRRRTHRIRPAFPGEVEGEPPAGRIWLKVVRQLRPGIRLRCTVFCNPHAPLPNDEAVAHGLFDVAVAAFEAGGEGFKPLDAELAARLALVGRGGAA